MRWNKISDAVIRRLPLYLRVLDELANEQDVTLISSQELGVKAGVGPALVRKDLAWFGEFGKQGVGYEVGFLRNELRKILNLEQEMAVALAGVGSLGEALVRYHLKRYADNDSFNLRLAALLTVIQLRWEPRWKGSPSPPWKRFPESGRGADQDRGAGGCPRMQPRMWPTALSGRGELPPQLCAGEAHGSRHGAGRAWICPGLQRLRMLRSQTSELE